MSSDQVELIDVKAVARLLSCSPRTVWRLRARGAIPQPFILSSGVVRWRKSTILRWLDECEATQGRPSDRGPKEGGEQ
mgnify:CR=1 FL=1